MSFLHDSCSRLQVRTVPSSHSPGSPVSSLYTVIAYGSAFSSINRGHEYYNTYHIRRHKIMSGTKAGRLPAPFLPCRRDRQPLCRDKPELRQPYPDITHRAALNHRLARTARTTPAAFSAKFTGKGIHAPAYPSMSETDAEYLSSNLIIFFSPSNSKMGEGEETQALLLA